MRPAGFLLAGGKSRRMGADKAQLKVDGRSLLERMAGELAAVCGSVTIVGGDRDLPGVARIGDDVEGIGPAGGILTALRRANGWCLVVAVDMPAVSRELLAEILRIGDTSSADCAIPVSEDGRIHPLCAAYHSRCLPAWESAVGEGVRKVREIIVRIPAVTVHPGSEEMLRNVNTPAEWQEFLKHAAR
jgi:molybdopterin-guanine dinucleotide biosynthesis protein A